MTPAPTPATFVALDSDGTVLDTMGPKQHRFLQPMLADALSLEGPLRDAYFACADFVNLRSAARGITRGAETVRGTCIESACTAGRVCKRLWQCLWQCKRQDWCG